MSLLNWVRYSWDLTTLPETLEELPAHYQIAPATKNDEMGVRKVFSSSFLLDPVWNSAIGEVMQKIQTELDRAFAGEGTCLALRHGSRIIGAAVVWNDAARENHLSPGPCVLMEYRNRGFGTRLLERSLVWLRQAGLKRCAAISLDYAPAARFLYPRFGGTMVPVADPHLLAA